MKKNSACSRKKPLPPPRLVDLGATPLPARSRGGGRPALYRLDTLAVGACRMVENRSLGAVCAAVGRYRRAHGGKFHVKEWRSGKTISIMIWKLEA